jgi:hypothetical protein
LEQGYGAALRHGEVATLLLFRHRTVTTRTKLCLVPGNSCVERLYARVLVSTPTARKYVVTPQTIYLVLVGFDLGMDELTVRLSSP